MNANKIITTAAATATIRTISLTHTLTREKHNNKHDNNYRGWRKNNAQAKMF